MGATDKVRAGKDLFDISIYIIAKTVIILGF